MSSLDCILDSTENHPLLKFIKTTGIEGTTPTLENTILEEEARLKASTEQRFPWCGRFK